ncbi:hypothetical protein ROHU_023870 [Labeo rohita]|uniref:Uncharacterized protein n=1 Tax=Labeo rohita TaxID=84645 RepID=A0A498LIF9_LABRO|nr:hypothetical protein ROHU_012087 [Labeo rohita]RXN21986.1 hypothetical protein ROHU_023870 [Labeo rohita]
MRPEEQRWKAEPKQESSKWGERWAQPRLVGGLLLRPDYREEPGLVRDNGGVEQGKFGALFEWIEFGAFAGVDLGAGLADFQGSSGQANSGSYHPPWT